MGRVLPKHEGVPQGSDRAGAAREVLHLHELAVSVPAVPGGDEGAAEAVAVTHGRYSTYTHGCRCAPCTEANRLYSRTIRKLRLERRREAPHGTLSGYKNWGCRCRACRKAACEWHLYVVRPRREVEGRRGDV